MAIRRILYPLGLFAGVTAGIQAGGRAGEVSPQPVAHRARHGSSADHRGGVHHTGDRGDAPASQRHLAQRQLRVLVTRAETAGVRASGLLVETGMPHEQIVRVARRKRADMNRDGHAWPEWAHAPLAGECRRPRDRDRQMSRPDGSRVISVEQSPTGPGAGEANAFEGREEELQHARRARRCRVSRSPRGVVDIPCVLRARARVLPPLSVAIRSRRSRARRPPPGAARCARTSVAAAPRRSR